MLVDESIKYPCAQCDYKATQKSHLKTHKILVHESLKYPCNLCDYKATVICNLKTHKMSYLTCGKNKIKKK